jgi:hypothetical protein
MALLKPSPAILHENPWCQQAADSYRAFIIGTEVGTNFPSSLFFFPCAFSSSTHTRQSLATQYQLASYQSRHDTHIRFIWQIIIKTYSDTFSNEQMLQEN